MFTEDFMQTNVCVRISTVFAYLLIGCMICYLKTGKLYATVSYVLARRAKYALCITAN